MVSPLAKKLQIKPGHRVAIINPPPGYVEELGELPEGVEVSSTLTGKFDLVHLFCKNIAELDGLASKAAGVLKADGSLWVSYPKQSSKVETDLNRDVLWKLAAEKGLTGVSMISIDDVWSAMRFKSDRFGKG